LASSLACAPANKQVEGERERKITQGTANGQGRVLWKLLAEKNFNI